MVVATAVAAANCLKKKRKGKERKKAEVLPVPTECLSVWSYKLINGRRWEESRRVRREEGGGRVLIEGEDGATCVCVNK